MDKNTIKNSLKERFLGEADLRKGSTPGINLTAAIRTKSGKENKKALKDMQKDLSAYDKSVKSDFESDSENKFNYNSETEETYHAQMEDMNGQEMIEFDRDPNKQYKDRAIQAIEGSANMGNNPEWANVVPKQQGFTGPEFGKNLVINIKASHKKRQDATDIVISFGDDIETVPKGSNPIARHSAYSINEEFGMNKDKNNKKPQIKEGMKRLNFKKEFNGVGNALKMIPESYKVDNKVFEMTDGVESYKIRWEGSLNEGKAVVLMASDKNLVNEDMNRMKQLMGYKSQDTLGIVKGKARLDENKVFGDIWNKTKTLLETEDMEGADATEGNWDGVTKKAPEATKHVQGSVKKDSANAKGKEGNPDKAVKHAPEAKTPMKSSKGANIESDADATEGNWDGVKKKAPEATKHVTMKESYEMEEEVEETEEVKTESKTKEANWDKAGIKQAPEAKKHVHMGKESKANLETEGKEEAVTEGIIINGIEFLPLNENWMGEETLEEEEETEGVHADLLDKDLVAIYSNDKPYPLVATYRIKTDVEYKTAPGEPQTYWHPGESGSLEDVNVNLDINAMELDESDKEIGMVKLPLNHYDAIVDIIEKDIQYGYKNHEDTLYYSPDYQDEPDYDRDYDNDFD